MRTWLVLGAVAVLVAAAIVAAEVTQDATPGKAPMPVDVAGGEGVRCARDDPTMYRPYLADGRIGECRSMSTGADWTFVDNRDGIPLSIDTCEDSDGWSACYWANVTFDLYQGFGERRALCHAMGGHHTGGLGIDRDCGRLDLAGSIDIPGSVAGRFDLDGHPHIAADCSWGDPAAGPTLPLGRTGCSVEAMHPGWHGFDATYNEDGQRVDDTGFDHGDHQAHFITITATWWDAAGMEHTVGPSTIGVTFTYLDQGWLPDDVER